LEEKLKETNKKELNMLSLDIDKDIKAIFKNNYSQHPIDPIDIFWLNLSSQVTEGCFKKTLIFLVIITMFIFFSTPAAIIQLLKQDKFGKKIFKLQWVNYFPGFIAQIIKNYFLTGITLICNKIFLIVVNKIAKEKRFSMKSKYQIWLQNNTFTYLV